VLTNRYRIRAATVAAVACAGLLLASGCGSGAASTASGAAGAGYDTITPGVMKVAVEPYMPYTAVTGGKLVGLDSEILQAVAKKLNLKIETQMTDFNGMLGGVQSRRADISIGGIAWTKERQQEGLFTDPPYYSPPAIAVRGDKTYQTVGDLKGLRLGTVTGYVWVKSIKAVDGAKLQSYPDANGVFADLAAGRLDVGFLDPLLIIYTQKQRPDQHFATEYLTPPSDADVAQKPDFQYFRPYMTSFYVPKQSPKLEKAVSAEIDKMYADGRMTALIKKYGGDPDQFLKPSPSMAGDRRGVDRPADWNPPSI
jgi:polar amino acid transport system substrate-binding protein